MTRKGEVSIHLDGPRSREFDVPDNWHDLTDAERDEIARPALESLMNDSTAWQIDAVCPCGEEAC